jgi:hypothetical protein
VSPTFHNLSHQVCWTRVMMSMEFWVVMLGRPKPAKAYHLLLLVSCLAYPSSLKTVCPSGSSGFLRTLQHCRPEDHDVSSHCSKNFRPKCSALWKYDEMN